MWFAILAAAAAAVTLAVMPYAERLAVRWGAASEPGARHIHDRSVPLAGGMAMITGVLAAAAVAPAIGGVSHVLASPREILGGAAGMAIAFGVGLSDDIRALRPRVKAAGTALCGVTLFAAGISIEVFRVPFGDRVFLSSGWSLLVTVLWVMGMANAVNLIDGLDGLAAGIVAIGSAAFVLYALRLTDVGIIDQANPGVMWAALALGACIGFLPRNLYPARVFMGDGGALLLGTLMAAATISVGGRSTGEFSGQAYFFYAPLFIPLVILGVPVFDTAFAIVRRTISRRTLSEADLEHLHHRLVRLGHGHRTAVVVLWLWTALLSGFVLYPTFTGRGDGIVPAGIAALALVLYTLFHPRRGT